MELLENRTLLASFLGLGDLDGGTWDSLASDVTILPDGPMVVGRGTSSSGPEAFSWTPTEGMVGKGDLPGGSFYSTAAALTPDGSTIVGGSVSSGQGSLTTEVARWTEDGNLLLGLGILPDDNYAYATGISADGSVIVGRGGVYPQGEATVWTETEGLVGLGGVNGSAEGISADGKVIAGGIRVGSSLDRPARWIRNGTGWDLEYLSTDTTLEGGASDASGDGSVMVGGARLGPAGEEEAFRWTASTGLIGLGDLPGGGYYSFAYAVSDEGSVVVGTSETQDTGNSPDPLRVEAFIWEADLGMRDLRSVLTTDYGLDLSGWHLTAAYGISPDGRAIVGVGLNPDGNRESWLAILDQDGAGLRLEGQQFFGGAGNEFGTGIAAVDVGGSDAVYAAGYNNANGNDGLVVRYARAHGSSRTETLWGQTWPDAAGPDGFGAVAATTEAAYAAGGGYSTTSDIVGDKEGKGITVAFPATGGVPTWATQTPAAPGAFSYGGAEILHGVAASTEAGQAYLYATGTAQSGFHNFGRLFLSKLDADGNVLWTRTDAGPDPRNDLRTIGYGVASHGGTVVVAGRDDDPGQPHAHLRVYDTSGSLAWDRSRTPGWFLGVTIDPATGDIYAVGRTEGPESDFLAEKWDAGGNLLWSRTYDRYASPDELEGVVLLDGRLFAVGRTGGGTAGGTDGILLELDPQTGGLLATTLWGGTADDSFSGVAASAADGLLYVVGSTQSYGSGGSDLAQLTYVVESTLSISDASLVEGNSGTTDLVFTVSRDGDISAPVTFDYTTSDRLARAGSDFAYEAGTVRIPAGETSAEIRIEVHGDRFPETDESFLVELSNASNATIVKPQGIGRIIDDDLDRSETLVNTTTAGIQQSPGLAMDANGNSVVVWSGEDGDGRGIFARRFGPDGEPLGDEFLVNTGAIVGDQTHPRAAMTDDGRFVLTWSGSGPGDDYGMFAKVFDADGTVVRDTFLVNTHTANYQIQGFPAMDASGNFVVSWPSYNQDEPAGLWGIYYQLFDAGGNPVGTERRANATTAGNQDGGIVARAPDGRFVIAWNSAGQDGDNWGTYARLFDASGQPVTGEFLVNETTTGPQTGGPAAFTSDGGFVVGWGGNGPGDGHGAYYRRFDAQGNPITGEIRVNEESINHQLGVELAVRADGAVLVTYTSIYQDGDDQGVYARVFDASDRPLWGEYRINATTIGSQHDSRVTFDPAGDLVIVWAGNGVGDDYGIFVERISSRPPVVEEVWVGDAVPAGATLHASGGDAWQWNAADPTPYSGSLAHRSASAPGIHQHYFRGAADTLDVAAGDVLFAHVYLDPDDMPRQLMLQWNDGSSWNHRAYWGEDLIGWGVDGTESRRRMGDLPAAGGWVRLEVPAAAVGLEGRTLSGMAFTLHDGHASWDHSGIERS